MTAVPDPATLSDEGLGAVATVLARMASTYAAVNDQAATDASQWLAAAVEVLAGPVHAEMRRRIDARFEQSAAELLDP